MKTIAEKELFDEVRKTLNGGQIFVPNPFSRMRNIFNIYSEQYILLGSVPGVGKTSMLDHILLNTIQEYPKNLHFETLYYSMERRKKFKYAKWLSWKLYDQKRIRVAATTVLNRDGTLTEKTLNILEKKYSKWLNNTMDYIDLRQGPKTVDQLREDILKKAKRLGVHYSSDDDWIYRFGVPLQKFPKNNFIASKFGNRYYTEVTIKGKKYTLYQNDNVFITDKPTILLIVIDHVGKVLNDGKSDKETLDGLDDVLSEARDSYGFSPVAISQFNRGIGGTERLKLSKGDLAPILEDFKGTGNLTESADLVISMFDPSRYKSWDSEGKYLGYNIRDGLVNIYGLNRSRSLHVLKNNLGADKGTAVIEFIGESGYFEQLPPASDFSGLQKVYDRIAVEHIKKEKNNDK